MAWDSLSDSARKRLQDQLVRDQVRVVAAGSAYWKQRFAEVGRDPAGLRSVDGLASLPAVGERDVSPSGDPAAMARLVMHGGEGLFALHATGPQLRRALRKRATRTSEYKRIVSADTRATTYAWSGLGFRYPLAYTRGDLDVVARAGARAWSVLGLTADDALLSALPLGATSEQLALTYAALGAGAPALFPGVDPQELTTAARLAPPTVLAAAAASAAEVVGILSEAGAGLERLTTLLLVGAPTADERAAARESLAAAGAGSATVLAVHAPSGARLLWAECRQSGGSGGLHTYPDLDVVHVVDPETGEHAAGAGELVLSQVGLRGSALLRWRTGDLVDAIETAPCPSCRRRTPRVMGARRGALVLSMDGRRTVDLRAVAGALAGRADVADWRVVVGGRPRDGRTQVVVHVAPSADVGEVTVGVAADIRGAAGTLPTQLVVAEDGALADLPGAPLTGRILLRR